MWIYALNFQSEPHFFQAEIETGRKVEIIGTFQNTKTRLLIIITELNVFLG